MSQLKALATAGAKVRDWTRERDRLIVEAHKAGTGPRAIARAVGLAHPSVIYIVRREAEES